MRHFLAFLGTGLLAACNGGGAGPDGAPQDGGADARASTGIIINEIMLNVPGAVANDLFGDANCDGMRNVDDQFIEIVNDSGANLDLSGHILLDAQPTPSARHVFAADTVVADGESIVIFGNLATTDAGHPWCSGVIASAVGSSSGSLGLDGSGDGALLRTGASVDVASLDASDWGAGHETAGSITRDPDLTGELTEYATATGKPGDRMFSPGTRINGSAF